MTESIRNRSPRPPSSPPTRRGPPAGRRGRPPPASFRRPPQELLQRRLRLGSFALLPVPLHRAANHLSHGNPLLLRFPVEPCLVLVVQADQGSDHEDLRYRPRGTISRARSSVQSRRQTGPF